MGPIVNAQPLTNVFYPGANRRIIGTNLLAFSLKPALSLTDLTLKLEGQILVWERLCEYQTRLCVFCRSFYWVSF